MNKEPDHVSKGAIDPGEFRRALGCFVTGVTVVTACQADGTPRGITANSFTSVSLEPPLVLVCIGQAADSYAVFRDCTAFAISILSEDQQTTSALFATKSSTKFDDVPWRSAPGGAPVLDTAVAWFDCVPHERIEAGDHLVLIGRVIELGASTRQPLGYCRGNYFTFELEQRAVIHRRGQRVRVGCILDAGDRVLLLRDTEREGGWTLPVRESAAGEGADPDRLREVIEHLDTQANLGSLFSVFDGPGEDELSIFYRGELSGSGELDPQIAKLFEYEQIPWEALPSYAYRTMLRRYVAERREFQFGIYVGSQSNGTVAALKP